jgi:hypothetical protein
LQKNHIRRWYYTAPQHKRAIVSCFNSNQTHAATNESKDLSNDKNEKIEVLRQSQGFTALEEQKSNSGLQVNGTLLSASVTDPVADFAPAPDILPPKFTPKRNKNTNGIAGLCKCTCMSDPKCA